MTGDVYCWGCSGGGSCGSTVRVRSRPVQVSALTGIVELAAGRTHTCAREEQGAVLCWGCNERGSLGGGPGLDAQATPVQVLNVEGAVQIAAGDTHTCARTSADSAIWCWGKNIYGQLGDGTTSSTGVSTPVRVRDHQGAVDISAGLDHTCSRAGDGSVWCWGRNHHGQLGDGTTERRLTPRKLEHFTDVVQIAAGWNHTCARRTDRTLWCWGDNRHGQLGDGTTTSTETDAPVQVQGLTDPIEVMAGYDSTCALEADGTLWCWGSNEHGQLGDGSTVDRTTPVQVDDIAHATRSTVGWRHSCAVREDGSAWCWGGNDCGRLGDGTEEASTTPVQVSAPED